MIGGSGMTLWLLAEFIVLMDYSELKMGGAPPPSAHFGLFLAKKKHKFSLSATNHQNTTRVNLFCLPSNEMTPTRMVPMVAICPIWLLW